ncbi:MAG: SPOR domain-containing protein [Sphingomonadales bacterium]|nr:SPOR domain-containing protein [Sphingomonadales bacterium]
MSRMSPKTGASAKAIRYAITGALTAGLLAGCAASSHLARAGDHAVRTAGKLGRAVDVSEQQVAANPNDAAARIALGQAYLDAGRFQSAATTFSDALKLGDTSGSTQLRLALAEIGAGDTRSAVTVLDESRDSIEASDRGLALALAGETGRGVAILLDALRAGENSPKLRQNLAFAYALDGRWREARIAMAQDVPADKIDDRIGDWAMMSRPEDVQRRVASLLSVPVGVRDAGQPEALALGQSASGERLAAAETPAPVAPAAKAELPAIDQAPAVAAPALAEAVPAPAAAPAASEIVTAPAAPSFAAAFAAQKPSFIAQPVVQAAPLAPAAPVRALRVAGYAAWPAAKPVSTRAVATTQGGTHLVQLGSFSSEANARRAWQIYTSRNPELRSMRLTITPAVVRGKNFWRVAVGGLDGNGASRLCSGLRNRGNACFAYAANKAPAGALPVMALAGTGMRVHSH